MAVKATLTIHVHDTGRVEVTGPLMDRLLCYGLLESARDIIQAYVHDPAKLVEPSLIARPGLGNGR